MSAFHQGEAMSRFRRRPGIIEAYRGAHRTVIPPVENGYQGLCIVYPGEYLCIDEQGSRFPCRPEMFARLFEPLDD
jgi:hypothetical protein